MMNSLNVETFVEYAIGMSFLVLRMIARLNFGGLSGLRLDDAFAVAGIVRFAPTRRLKCC